MNSSSAKDDPQAQPLTEGGLTEYAAKQFPSVEQMLADDKRGQGAPDERPANANGQTDAERKLDIDRLEAVLQGYIVMLRDNPDIPIADSVSLNARLPTDDFKTLVQRHGLRRYTKVSGFAELTEALGHKYIAESDRAGFYLPWTVSAYHAAIVEVEL